MEKVYLGSCCQSVVALPCYFRPVATWFLMRGGSSDGNLFLSWWPESREKRLQFQHPLHVGTLSDLMSSIKPYLLKFPLVPQAGIQVATHRSLSDTYPNYYSFEFSINQLDLFLNSFYIFNIAWPILVKWILSWQNSLFSFPVLEGIRKFRGKQVTNIKVNELANVLHMFG